MVLLSALVAASVGGCGDDDDGAAGEPPWCLSGVRLPDDAETVEATLAALPAEFNSHQQELVSSPERIEVYYDEPLEGMPSLQAVSVDALEQAFPQAGELSAFEALEIMLEAGIEPVDPGGITGEMDEVFLEPDAGLVWATGDTIERAETPEDDIRAPSMVFADPDGRWIFTALAATEELRVELVEAFCAAISQ